MYFAYEQINGCKFSVNEIEIYFMKDKKRNKWLVMNSGKCFPRNGSCFHCEIIFVTYEYESLAFYRCSISFVEKYLCWMNLFTFFFSEFSTYQHKTLSLHIFSTNSVGMKKITRTLCVCVNSLRYWNRRSNYV